METRSGFTLIQLFIVIILCVLWLFATIVVVQFTTVSTSSSSGHGKLDSDLMFVRSQIELYKIHHKGDLPGTAAGVSFEQALTQKTFADGSLNPAAPCAPYGPYLRKIPVNLYNGLDTVEIDGVRGGGDYGWHFNTTTGEFHTDTDEIHRNLMSIRYNIMVYKMQHYGELPGTVECVSFEQALTQKTNAYGAPNPTGRYGRYRKKIPVNPYNGLDTVEIDGVLGGGDYGWHFNTTTGEFHADTDKHTGL